MNAADHLVDLGPGAGEHGGEVVAEGTPAQVKKVSHSLTGQYLAGRRSIAVPEERRRPTGELRVKNAREHNLKGIDASFPLGTFTCVTGVSGSGKSTLVNEILYRSAANRLHRARSRPGAHDGVEGIDQIDKIINIDQSPIGRTPTVEPGDLHGPLRRDPRHLLEDQGGPRARVQAGPLLVQRQGRALRGLPRRRADQDRDALPARRLRPVRAVPRPPLQPRDARGPLQGQVDRRRPRHAGRRGARVLRARSPS